MAFTGEQSALLNGKLDPKNVKKPSGSFGPKGDYIEGWHAIAEANRIFGFDGWSYRIVEIKECHAPYQNEKGNTSVGYIARVEVLAGGVSREDIGYGSGHAKGIGDAHESAVKEAVTDALKRGLKSFGNPFGLALYDKTQANVGVDKPAPEFVTTPDGRKRKPGPRLTDGGEIAAILEALRENVGKQPNAEKIKTYAKSQAAGIGSLPDAEFDTFMRDYDDLLKLRSEAA